MPCTEYFYVSSKDNKVKKTTEPNREYFIENGKKQGEAKYIIEVFGYNHEKIANEVKNMVEKSGMDNKLFTIRVETK